MRVEAGPKALINFAIAGAGIAIAAAYHAICSKLPEDAPLWPVHRRDGQLPIHIEAAVLDRLTAMWRRGESYSDAILRLVETKARA